MKAIFLDIDGVLNSQWYFASPRCQKRSDRGPSRLHRMAGDIDPYDVHRLNVLVGSTGAKIVISSSWRHVLSMEDMQEIFEMRGCDAEIAGVTPRFHWGSRGNRIEWFVRCGEIDLDAFVILDDAHPDHIKPMERHHIWTTYERGLQDHHVLRAIRMLNEKED